MDSERFDEIVIHICKWIVTIALLPAVVMPLQIVWFLFYPIIRLLNKKAKENATIESWTPSDMGLWFVIEIYGKLAKKFLGLEN
jgi:ABC-type phosphate transport system permease subunit